MSASTTRATRVGYAAAASRHYDGRFHCFQHELLADLDDLVETTIGQSRHRDQSICEQVSMCTILVFKLCGPIRHRQRKLAALLGLEPNAGEAIYSPESGRASSAVNRGVHAWSPLTMAERGRRTLGVRW